VARLRDEKLSDSVSAHAPQVDAARVVWMSVKHGLEERIRARTHHTLLFTTCKRFTPNDSRPSQS
jgi:hypothetical protein